MRNAGAEETGARSLPDSTPRKGALAVVLRHSYWRDSILSVILLALPCTSQATDYNEAFVRAKQIVEESGPLRLRVRLEQRSIELRDAPLRTACYPVAYFDRTSATLVVDPDRCESFFAVAKTVQERQDAAVLLMLHELIHAYQAVELEKSPSAKLQDRCLRFVCEGHAIAFSHQLARAAGVRRAILEPSGESYSPRFCNDFIENQATLLHQFLYLTSSRYVQAKCSGLQDFRMLLNKPLTYAEVLGNRSPAPASTEPRSRIKRLAIGGCTVTEGVDLDYLDAMALICPELFAQADLASAYRAGTLTEVTAGEELLIEVGILHLATEDAATRLWKAGRKRCSSASALATRESDRGARSADGEKVWIARGYPGPDRSFLMKRDGDLLLVMDFPARKGADTMVARILSALP